MYAEGHGPSGPAGAPGRSSHCLWKRPFAGWRSVVAGCSRIAACATACFLPRGLVEECVRPGLCRLLLPRVAGGGHCCVVSRVSTARRYGWRLAHHISGRSATALISPRRLLSATPWISPASWWRGTLRALTLPFGLRDGSIWSPVARSICHARSLRCAGSIALAGAVDLRLTIELAGDGVFAHDRDEVYGLMGGTPAGHPERYRDGNPGDLLPLAAPQISYPGHRRRSNTAQRCRRGGPDLRTAAVPRPAFTFCLGPIISMSSTRRAKSGRRC